MSTEFQEREISLFDSRFEFISPLTPDECAERLRDKHEPKRISSASNPLKITVVSRSDGGYTFTLQRDAGRNLIVELNGTLETMPDDSTRIYGDGRVSRITILGFLIIIAIQFPICSLLTGFVLGFLYGFLLYALILFAIIAVFWSRMGAEYRRMVELLVNTLGSLDGVTETRDAQ
jgi:hypothetical protein